MARKEDFVEVLKANDFERYIELLRQLLPKRIYRYCEHSNGNLDSVINKKLPLANPRTFNDPFDSLANEVFQIYTYQSQMIDLAIQKIIYNGSDKIVKELKMILLKTDILKETTDYNQKARKLISAIDLLVAGCPENEAIKLNEIKWLVNRFFGFSNQYIGDFVTNSAIGCFSETNLSVLMWAHYGRNCSGLCIEYNAKQLVDEVIKGTYYLLPIIYSDTIYSDYYRTISEDNLAILWNLPQFMYKHTQWFYEMEWRLVFLDSKAKSIPFINPTAVFLGASFVPYNTYKKNDPGSDENGQLIKYIEFLEYASREGIEIHRTKSQKNKYGLEFA